MKTLSNKIWATLLLTMITLPSLANKNGELDPPNDSNVKAETIENGATLYVATNKTEGNSIVAVRQNQDGSLIKIGEYMTGGKGTGKIEIFDWGYDETHPLKDGVDPLISAYGIMKTQDEKHLLVVNSGDATVSSLSIQKDMGLKLNNVVPAGDIHPLSIANYGNLVVVASSGKDSGNIMAYTIDPQSGKLSEITGSKRELKARPSCVAFTSNGKHVVVNELATGKVKVYSVNSKGLISKNPISMIDSPHAKEKGRWLAIPVGFDVVKKGNMDIVLMSEARFLDNMGNLREEMGKVPQSPKYSWQTGSTSSYAIDMNGKIKLISGDVMTGKSMEGGQIANCWVEVSKDANTLWAANALSSSISSYDIGDDGSIKLNDETSYKMKDESLFFSDLYTSQDGKFLNQLIGNKGGIKVFKVHKSLNGVKNALEPMGMYSNFGIPAVGSYGMISL